MLHHILQQIGFDAWACAAGFKSTTEAMEIPGTAVFIRASMRAQIEANQNAREEAN